MSHFKRFSIINTLFILFLAFLSTELNSKEKPKFQAYKFGDHWHINLKSGSSLVLTEYDNGFKSFRNEMKHLPGFAGSVSFSKLVSKHWEIGYEYEHSRFNGFNNNPNFTAINYHELISQMDIEPVVYKTICHNHGVNLFYHFSNFGSLKGGASPLNLFVNLKAGFLMETCELSYKENADERYSIIFAKRRIKDVNLKNSSLYIGTLQIGLGIGLRYHINDRLQLLFNNDYTFINDDLLDAVHNYIIDNKVPVSNQTNGIYTRIIAGISYNFSWNNDSKNQSFYKSTYKSSRYAPKPSHKIKKERDIWYTK